MRTNRIALFLLAFTLVLSGCAPRVGTVKNLPPGVTQQQVQNWYSATGAFTNIANVNHQILEGVVTFHDTGVWTDQASYEISLRALGRIDQIQIEAATFLKTVPNNWGLDVQAKVRGYTDEIAAEIQKVNASGATGIKNPDSLKTINGLIARLTQAADLIFSLLQALHPATT